MLIVQDVPDQISGHSSGLEVVLLNKLHESSADKIRSDLPVPIHNSLLLPLHTPFPPPYKESPQNNANVEELETSQMSVHQIKRLHMVCLICLSIQNKVSQIISIIDFYNFVIDSLYHIFFLHDILSAENIQKLYNSKDRRFLPK